MRVGDVHVEAMRRLLTRDVEGFERIQAELGPAPSAANGALISAAFFKAAERRFADGGTEADAVAFVADLRARSSQLAADLDPRIAERLLLATFADEEIDDIGDEARGQHCLILLGGLIADASLSDAQLNAFLDDARKLANEWLADDPR